MKFSILISVFFFFAQSGLQGKISYYWKSLNPEFDLLAVQLEETSFNDGDYWALYPVVKEMYRIAQTEKNSTLQARALFWESAIWLPVNRDSAACLIEKAFSLTDSAKYTYDYARIQLVRADILRSGGDWVQAYRMVKELETHFIQLNDLFYLAKVNVFTGVILRELQEYETALTYLRKGEEFFKKVGSKSCETKNKLNICNTLYNVGRKEEALKQLKDLVNDPIARKDTSFLVNTLISLYSISGKQGGKYAAQAHHFALAINNRQLISMTLTCLGAHMLIKNEKDSALNYYKKAHAYINHYNDASNLFPILCGLSESYSRLGCSDSAYYYLKTYEQFRDSLLAQDKLMEVKRSESRVAIEKYESNIRQAQEKASWQTKLTFIITFSVVMLSLLIFYILWLSRKKEKIKMQLKRGRE